MDAVKAGCTPAVTVRGAAEGVTAALKTAGRGKRPARTEYDATYRKKRQAQSDAQFESWGEKMEKVGKIWTETPEAALTRHLTAMKGEDKISMEDALLLSEYFIATNKETDFCTFFAGLGPELKDDILLKKIPQARQWITQRGGGTCSGSN